MDLTAARAAARGALESLFEGTCVITGFTDKKNEVTKETEQVSATLYSGACRISQSAATVKQTESAANIEYDALLFLPAGVSVSAGCEITVTQNGVTAKYEQAGEPPPYAILTQVKVKRVARA